MMKTLIIAAALTIAATAASADEFATTTCMSVKSGEYIGIVLNTTNHVAAVTDKDGDVATGSYIYRKGWGTFIKVENFQLGLNDTNAVASMVFTNGSQYDLACESFKPARAQ